MQINGPSLPVTPYRASDPAGKYPQHRPNPQTPSQPVAAPVAQAGKAEASSDANRQRRFYPQERDLSYSARQAINNYRDSDFAGGPELMNRVDVYA